MAHLQAYGGIGKTVQLRFTEELSLQKIIMQVTSLIKEERSEGLKIVASQIRCFGNTVSPPNDQIQGEAYFTFDEARKIFGANLCGEVQCATDLFLQVMTINSLQGR